MQPIIYSRKGIPFFYNKSELEIRQDIYERYHEMVVRQTSVHLADEIWGRYPFQPIFDFAEKHYPKEVGINILEIGCGVGRWIASLAKYIPNSTCWGIDYSYQMLKCAKEFWTDGKEISFDLSEKGLGQLSKKEMPLTNLKFGLAKAEKLPFEADSQKIVVSSFLLDRLENPRKSLEEMYRVLSTTGRVIIISPLNFKKSEHWKLYYPSSQLSDIIKEIGFKILEWKEDMIVNEPLDGHGNLVRWKCLCFVLEK